MQDCKGLVAFACEWIVKLGGDVAGLAVMEFLVAIHTEATVLLVFLMV